MSEQILAGGGNQLGRASYPGAGIQINFMQLTFTDFHLRNINTLRGHEQESYNQENLCFGGNYEYFDFTTGTCVLCLVRVHRRVGYDFRAYQPQSTCKRINFAGGCAARCRNSFNLSWRGAGVPASQ